MGKIVVPSAYAEGYITAQLHNKSLADNYVRHITVGDPELDPVIRELSSLPPVDFHRFIRAGIEQQDDVLRQAPKDLRDFFDQVVYPSPPWLDHDAFRPGVVAFLANVDLMLVAFVTGVLVEGFSTLIAKSFNITKRVGSTSRRLQQNNRQIMDIFFPGGLQMYGDGWKLSVRVRFVHSRIRVLLENSEAWNHEAWGTPVSAAHLGFAISVFSKRLLEYSVAVGAKFDKDASEGVLAVWRYAGYLMGIPETILYTTGSEAEQTYTIGHMCEPTPDADSIEVANTLIQSIPKIADITDPKEREEVIALAYRLSRALIGHELANRFDYPKYSTLGALFLYRIKQRISHMFRDSQLIRSQNFTQLMQISVYDDDGISYKMPDHVHSHISSKW